MYFDIVLVSATKTRKKDIPHRPETKTQQRRRGEGQAIQHVARIVRYDRPVMGLWISYVGPLFSQMKYQQMLGKTNRFQKHLWHKWHVWQSFAFVSDITCNIGAKIKLPTVCSFPFPAGAFSKQSWGLSSHIESNFKLYLIPVSYRPKRELLLNPANHLSTHQSLSFHHQDSSGSHSSAVSLSLPFFSLVDFPFPLDLGDLVA